MSLSDDLNADLQNVFFADFNDIAVINGAEVVGFLDTNAHQWADLDTNQHIFITALPPNIILKRSDTLTIAEQLYKYVTQRKQGALTHLVISPS